MCFEEEKKNCSIVIFVHLVFFLFVLFIKYLGPCDIVLVLNWSMPQFKKEKLNY
jgi:hypothetical protein